MDDRTDDQPDCEGCRRRDREIERLRERIDELEGTVEELDEIVGRLKAKQAKDSTNSSKPPSSDGPGEGRDGDCGEDSDRQQGAQPGHEGHHREDVPSSEVDEVEDVKPDECRCCGAGLAGEDRKPSCHQVTDVEIEKYVTEYRQHSLECDDCGAWTLADLPDEVPTSSFGPVVSAIATYLTGVARLSRRTTRRAVGDVCDVEMSLGTVSNLEARATDALEQPYIRTRDEVQQSDQIHLDETSWQQAGDNRWLWVMTDRKRAVYRIDPSRGSEVAEELLGDQPSGTVITDRHGAYNWIETDARQLCLAHLQRNFKGWALENGLTGELGALLAGYIGDLFDWLADRRSDPATRSESGEIADLREAISTTLKVGAEDAEDPDRFRQLLKVEDAMWTFLDEEDVPPTNNAAERAVRPAVMWRKHCFGTESERGSRYVERTLSVVETLRRQGREVMGFFEDAWRHISSDEPMPRLLPT
ncbi:MAG: IS66 family transposase [Bradymonadaceae bacterium]